MKFIQTRKHHTKWGRESRFLVFWATEILQGIILSLRVKLQQCGSDNGPYLDSLTPFLYTLTPIKDPLSHHHNDISELTYRSCLFQFNAGLFEGFLGLYHVQWDQISWSTHSKDPRFLQQTSRAGAPLGVCWIPYANWLTSSQEFCIIS